MPVKTQGGGGQSGLSQTGMSLAYWSAMSRLALPRALLVGAIVVMQLVATAGLRAEHRTQSQVPLHALRPLTNDKLSQVRHALRRQVARKQPAGYKKILESVERRDPSFGLALRAAALDSTSVTLGTNLQAHRNRLNRLFNSLGAAESIALNKILNVHYQSKNRRWGFVGVGARVRKSMAAAKTEADRIVELMHAKGLVPLAAVSKLKSSMKERVEGIFQQTKGKRFPDQVPLRMGRGRWWNWLARFAQVTPRRRNDYKLLLDGPAWRAATLKTVAEAKGYLHIASWAWHYDDAGRLLANAVVARKLSMPLATVEKLRSEGQSVAQIRDSRLLEVLSGKQGGSLEAAQAKLRSLSETARQELVNVELDGLKMRVLLGARIQQMDKLRAGFNSVIPDLRSVGVEVVEDNRLFQKRFPFVQPIHAWAAVPHAKLMITPQGALSGGMNIGNHYMQPEGEPLVWHDAAMSIKGDVVQDLAASFSNHWNRAVKKRGIKGQAIDRVELESVSQSALADSGELPKPSNSMVIGTDDLTHSRETRYSHRTALMMALASASRSFEMVVPFFNSPLLVKHLIRTARRFKAEGRDPSLIRIVITGNATQPGTSDFFTNHYAFLLQREGIRVEAWKPDRPGGKYTPEAVHHAKAWIVDNKIAYLGSANANVRSLVQDWEVGVLTDEKSFVREVADKIFAADRKHCQPIKIRPAWQRRIGHAINLLLGPVLRFL